jgi:hypothetical protein
MRSVWPSSHYVAVGPRHIIGVGRQVTGRRWPKTLSVCLPRAPTVMRVSYEKVTHGLSFYRGQVA